MLRYMFHHLIKPAILIVALFSSCLSLNIAVAAQQDEQTKNFMLAQNLAQKGEVDQAIAIYTSLIQTNPLLPEAYNNLAALYLKKKDSKQAKHILEQGLHAHKGYGVLYESLTAINVAMAREAYSKALQFDLKPADITIASLSLNDSEVRQKKNTIVISKVSKQNDSNESNESKPVIKAKTVPNAKLSGEISRISAASMDVKNPETIKKILQAWSVAWSAQAVDMYLSFYHNNYKPSNGVSRNGWEQSRRLKLKKPDWIKVDLSNFNIEKNNGRQAIVEFKQSYQSNSYRDVSLKRMVLLYTDNGWKIFQEKSI